MGSDSCRSAGISTVDWRNRLGAGCLCLLPPCHLLVALVALAAVLCVGAKGKSPREFALRCMFVKPAATVACTYMHMWLNNAHTYSKGAYVSIRWKPHTCTLCVSPLAPVSPPETLPSSPLPHEAWAVILSSAMPLLSSVLWMGVDCEVAIYCSIIYSPFQHVLAPLSGGKCSATWGRVTQHFIKAVQSTGMIMSSLQEHRWRWLKKQRGNMAI